MNEGEKKLDWMYKGANSLTDREEYLLGRTVDKTLEQINAEEKEKNLGIVVPKNHVEHECIPPSIRDFNKIVKAEQVDISAKLQEDPLMAIKKREEEARRQFLQNPVQLKKLQEALKKQESKKRKKNSKKDLDKKIVEKLKLLKSNSSAKFSRKDVKDDTLDTIIMHKFNELKDKLSQDDLDDILAGKISGSEDEEKPKKKKKQKAESENKIKSKSKKYKKKESSSDSSSESSSSEYEKVYKSKLKTSNNKRNDKSREKYRKRDTSSDGYNFKGKTERYKKSTKTIPPSKKTDDLESIILEKLRMLRDSTTSKANDGESEKKHKSRKSEQRRGKSSSSTESDSEDENIGKTKKKTQKRRSSSSSTGSDRKNAARRSKKDLEDAGTEEKYTRFYKTYNSDTEEHDYVPRNFGLIKADGTQIELNKKKFDDKNTLKSFKTDKETPVTNVPSRKSAKKLTEEEKEKLRREMMKDAKIRDKDRNENLKKYREEDVQEARKAAHFDKDFIHKELLKTTKSATIETRIKSNLNNIQRSSRAMNSNFSRKN